MSITTTATPSPPVKDRAVSMATTATPNPSVKDSRVNGDYSCT